MTKSKMRGPIWDKAGIFFDKNNLSPYGKKESLLLCSYIQVTEPCLESKMESISSQAVFKIHVTLI